MKDELERTVTDEPSGNEESDRPTIDSSFILHPSSFFIGFLAAIQFLTMVPPLIRRQFTATELGGAVGWFAVAGLLLGASLAGADYAFSLLFPPAVTAALILTMWVLMTGALHLDGFLDTCDGLFGGHTTESRLRIMRDERVGAYAVIGGILLLLLKFSCLIGLASHWVALIVAATVARWGLVLSIVAFPYARTEGLGKWMKDNSGWRQVVLASLTALGIVVLAGGWLGVITLALTAVVTGAVAAFVLRRLPGLTGDVYGALCEILETVALLTFVAGDRL